MLFSSEYLDNGQMIYDFGLMKLNLKDLVDSFDHAISIWSGDDSEYIESIKKHSARWIELPVSPSAEQLSRVIFIMIDKLLFLTHTKNGEKSVGLHSVIVHETQTGYAQCFRDDAYSEKMGLIDMGNIIFSDDIINEWNDKHLWYNIQNGVVFHNPQEC
jgi:6-pyruvoyltetrahydropterin/6-carboxytetrahydropterin synthase